MTDRTFAWRAAESQYRDRFEAILTGRPADGNSIGAWQHYPGIEYDPATLSKAIAASVVDHDWGWLKINPRGNYYAEIFGATYDESNYGGGEVPAVVTHAFPAIDSLAGIKPQLDSPVIAEQAELQRRLRELLPDRPLVYTVFSPLSVLFQGLGLPLYIGGKTLGTQPAVTYADVWGADPELLHGALEAITVTLVELATRLREAGADGLFYAVTGTANAALSRDQEWFSQFSTPYDLRVLAAVSDGANVLHTCGPESNPQWFADWPVDALHWDQLAAGNPGLGDLPIAVGGGVDYRIFNGEHDDVVTAEVAAAKAAAGDRPFLLSPTCTCVSGGLSDQSLELLKG